MVILCKLVKGSSLKLQNNICKLKKDIIHIKTMEEIAELINCLSSQDINLNNLAEEICDVYINLYRLKATFYV